MRPAVLSCGVVVRSRDVSEVTIVRNLHLTGDARLRDSMSKDKQWSNLNDHQEHPYLLARGNHRLHQV